MNEQIKFDGKYYSEVKSYFESRRDLRGRASFGGESRIYLTDSKRIKGFILQKCGDVKNPIGVVSVINSHPSFNQIKSDLEKIIKKNE